MGGVGWKKKSPYKNTGECRFKGCKNAAAAKDLCSTHYRQQLNGQKLRPINKKKSEAAKRERLEGIERELKRAKDAYLKACGFQARVKWRQEINKLEAQLRKEKE